MNVSPDQLSAGRQVWGHRVRITLLISGTGPNESRNSSSSFSQAKAAIATGDGHADTEMKDEQKKDVAGSQPQVETEA